MNLRDEDDDDENEEEGEEADDVLTSLRYEEGEEADDVLTSLRSEIPESGLRSTPVPSRLGVPSSNLFRRSRLMWKQFSEDFKTKREERKVSAARAGTPVKIRLPMRHRKEIATILVLIAVATEFVGLSMGLPILVQLSASFGVGHELVGLVFSVSPFAQMISDLWIPMVSDMVDRKSILIFSLIGSIGAFALQAYSPTFQFLLLATFLGGLFGGTQPVAVSYISDIFPPAERPRFIGMVPACATVCFTIGPALGGAVANLTGSLRAPLIAAALIAAPMLPIIWAFLPDSSDLLTSVERTELKRKEEEDADLHLSIAMKSCRTGALGSTEKARATTNAMKRGRGVVKPPPSGEEGGEEESSPLVPGPRRMSVVVSSDFKRPVYEWRCWCCFFLELCRTLAIAAFITMIPLILDDESFGIDDAEDAVFYSGLVIGIGSAGKSIGLIVLFDRIQKRIGLTRTILVGSIMSLLGYVVLVFQNTVAGMAIGFSIFTMGSSLVQPGVFSYVTCAVPTEYTARAVGFPNFATSLGQTIAPIASTELLVRIGYTKVFAVITATLFVHVILAATLFRKLPSQKSDDRMSTVVMPLDRAPSLSRDDFEEELTAHLLVELSHRNYDLNDGDTQRVVKEMLSKSFPYLRDDPVGNREDVEELAAELHLPRSSVVIGGTRPTVATGSLYHTRRDDMHARDSMARKSFAAHGL